MNSAKFIYKNDRHILQEASNRPMDILGIFLNSDARCSKSSWQKWALDSKSLPEDYDYPYVVGSNVTFLMIDKNENLRIYFELDEEFHERGSCSYNENASHTKMTVDQFVSLLNEWYEKVCLKKPQEILLKHINDQYIIEIVKK